MTPPKKVAAVATHEIQVALRPPMRWVTTQQPSGEVLTKLAQELNLPESVCHLLAIRGYTEPEDAKRFLRPRLEHIESPWKLHDCDKAVERITRAIRNGETIFVHGDYDVDGMCSTTALTNILRGLGAGNVVPFVPNRLTDGYDLGPAGVTAAFGAQAGLLITCDCGTSAHEAIDTLMNAGVDVIVTDHHLPKESLPKAYAICNPQQPSCGSSDKGLAAVGVVYKLGLALCEAMGASLTIAHQQLDLVALATIADVAPLRGENRTLVRYGLKMLADTQHPGLRALIRSSGLDSKTLTAGRVGFVLAPRLNAAGRIADARLGLELLLAESEENANALARELEELNRARQALDRTVLDQALRQLDMPGMQDRYGFVLAQEGWHAGVIGIVASRIVEYTARPVVLVAVDGAVGKGSGRSIRAFDLHAGLDECSDLFQRFGGHRSAAGLTMDTAHIPAFAERFDQVVRSQISAEDLIPELRIDLEVPLGAVDDELERLLRYFEPFGIGNPSPVFRTNDVSLAAPARRVGTDGLKLSIKSPGGVLPGIGWGLGARVPKLELDARYELAFRIEQDDYRGEAKLQLRVTDLRASSADTSTDTGAVTGTGSEVQI